MSKSVSKLYNNHLRLGQRLLNEKDKQDRLLAKFDDRFARVSEVAQNLAKRGSSRTRKSPALLAFLVGITDTTNTYYQSSGIHNKSNVVQVFPVGHYRKMLDVLLRSHSGAKAERNVLSEMYQDLVEMDRLFNEANALGEAIHQGTGELLTLRRQIDVLMDEQIQELSVHDLRLASDNADQAITKLGLINQLIQPISLILIIVSTWLMTWLIQRPIKAIKARTDSDCRKYRNRLGPTAECSPWR